MSGEKRNPYFTVRGVWKVALRNGLPLRDLWRNRYGGYGDARSKTFSTVLVGLAAAGQTVFRWQPAGSATGASFPEGTRRPAYHQRRWSLYNDDRIAHSSGGSPCNRVAVAVLCSVG